MLEAVLEGGVREDVSGGGVLERVLEGGGC